MKNLDRRSETQERENKTWQMLWGSWNKGVALIENIIEERKNKVLYLLKIIYNFQKEKQWAIGNEETEKGKRIHHGRSIGSITCAATLYEAPGFIGVYIRKIQGEHRVSRTPCPT